MDPTIARAFDRLADPDPDVRAAARDQLMGLSRPGLAKLLDVVRAARPVRPAQAAVLYDIVRHVFLATDPDGLGAPDPVDPPPADGEVAPGLYHPVRGYKMGIRWPTNQPDDGRLGTPVIERWPGFPAYRLLHDGDLILAISVRPDLPPDQLPNRLTPTFHDVQRAMADALGIRDIVLTVLRDGRPVHIPMRLVAQPIELIGDVSGVAAEAYLRECRDRADAYWQSTFAPALPATDQASPSPLDS